MKLLTALVLLCFPALAFADPISAVISISTMAGIAKGGMAALTLAKGIAFAGSAINLVGNVTKNKKLAKIGAITGLVGGVGMVAEGIGKAAAQRAGGQVTAARATQGAGAATGGVGGDVLQNRLADVSRTAAAPGGWSVPTAGTGVAPVAQEASKGLIRGAMDTAGKVGKGLMEMTRDNPELAMVLAKGTGAVADWLTGKTDLELETMKSTINLGDARAKEIYEAIEIERKRRENLNAGYENVQSPLQINPVSMQPSNPYLQMPGLIAGARG
jgi:hypothetical protein